MRFAVAIPAGVVLLALGAIGAVAQLDQASSTRPPAVRQVAVTSAARACPPP